MVTLRMVGREFWRYCCLVWSIQGTRRRFMREISLSAGEGHHRPFDFRVALNGAPSVLCLALTLGASLSELRWVTRENAVHGRLGVAFHTRLGNGEFDSPQVDSGMHYSIAPPPAGEKLA